MEIDKTAAAEEILGRSRVLYLEGAAACGKTTLIRMLCEKHPEAETVWFRMEEELRYPAWLCRELGSLREKLIVSGGQRQYLIFEDLPARLPAEVSAELICLVRRMPDTCRVILSARQRPEPELVKLLWHGEMEILPQSALRFTREEVRRLVQAYLPEAAGGPDRDPDMLYEITGGWPGCVIVLLRQAAHSDRSWKELRCSHEAASYITAEICGPLTGEQRGVLQLAALFPRMNEELCLEAFPGEGDQEDPRQPVGEMLEELTRGGYLIRSRKGAQWQLTPLLAEEFSAGGPGTSQAVCQKLCRKLFRRIPFADISGAVQTDPEDEGPKAAYLRGMQAVWVSDAAGTQREIDRVRAQMERMLRARREEVPPLPEEMPLPEEVPRQEAAQPAPDAAALSLCAEVYLNLTFASPAYTLEAWLALLEETAEACAPFGITSFSLYGTDGAVCSCLCGLRDLTGLFTGSRKQQTAYRELWQRCLGNREWIVYRLARLEYALDLMREEDEYQEDAALLSGIVNSILHRPAREDEDTAAMRRFGLPALVLLCRLQRIRPDEESAAAILQLEEVLAERSLPSIGMRSEAAAALYAPWCGRPQRLTQYLQQTGKSMSAKTCGADGTYAQAEDTVLFCMAKGYLWLGQYEKARRYIRRLIPVLSAGNRGRYLAEAQFMQAVAAWGVGEETAAVRYALESFLTTGGSRYVSFYTEYGKAGLQVLKAYINWMKEGQGTGWSRKRPYVYSNAGQMPMQQYLDTVLYQANRRQVSPDPAEEELAPEQLTMMETALLQDLGQGMTNAQICEAHGLQLTTVKTHLYNLYRKLDVKSRSQAVIKGRERGLLP